jgi:hypothetical protein
MSERWIRAGRDRESHSEELNKEKPGKDLLELVCARAGCNLSDPRDMIYAHLGLVGAETRNMVPIDYEKTVAQLYTSMTELYGQWIGIWNIVTLAEAELERRDPSFPSWVVDWSLAKPQWAETCNSLPRYGRQPLRPSSLAVPHILAVCGCNFGPIDSIIPASSWPTIPNNPFNSTIYIDAELVKLDDSMLKNILDWVSRSDDNVLRARRALVDFTIPMANAGFDSFYQKWRPSDSFLWDVIIIATCQWPELPTTSRPLCRVDNPDPRGSFIQLCLRNLVFLATCSSGDECVVVLKSKKVVARVPIVAQPGDFFADIRMSGPSDYTLFRPCGLELNREEEELIRNDFRVRYPPSTDGLPHIYESYWPDLQAPFHNCRYVAHTASITYGDPLREAGEYAIFALH